MNPPGSVLSKKEFFHVKDNANPNSTFCLNRFCATFAINLGNFAKRKFIGFIFVMCLFYCRLDLLCIEGLVQSLKVYLQQISMPEYRAVKIPANERQKIIMRQPTQLIRKYCVGAVLRNIVFTKEIYDSFIDLQVRLDRN